jgi:GNAT superfamily N-acetyltransferase
LNPAIDSPALLNIRRALPEEAGLLTVLMRASKAQWGYDAQQMAAWEQDLLLLPEQLERDSVFLAEWPEADDRRVAGFYTLLRDGSKPAARLEHFFVDPALQGRGAGSQLWRHALQQARLAGCQLLEIDADPNAEGFYLARGARRVAVVAAPIAGNAVRIRPQLQIAV